MTPKDFINMCKSLEKELKPELREDEKKAVEILLNEFETLVLKYKRFTAFSFIYALVFTMVALHSIVEKGNQVKNAENN